MGENPEQLMKETVRETEMAKESPLKRWIGFCLRYILPIGFTVALLVYLFHQVDFGEMLRILRHGVDYWWILLAMGISIFSHVFRAARWRLQLRALGVEVPFMALCCSIFGCYALNLVFPRLGELWRCTYISGFKKKSFTTVFGSMIADRASDSVMVGLLLILSLILAGPAIETFLDRYPIGRNIVELATQPWFWIWLAVAIIVVVVLFFIFRNLPFVFKLKEMSRKMWQGIIVISKMEGKWKFLIFTLGIWGCYFIQLYVAFYAFGFTRDLVHTAGLGAGFIPCLVAFVLSSISMAIPSNGGLGPWNIAIMFGLAIYGVSEIDGTAFSMVQWSGQTVMLILLGIFTMGYISLHSKKAEKEREGDLKEDTK